MPGLLPIHSSRPMYASLNLNIDTFKGTSAPIHMNRWIRSRNSFGRINAFKAQRLIASQGEKDPKLSWSEEIKFKQVGWIWAGGFVPYPIDAKVEDDFQSGMHHITLGQQCSRDCHILFGFSPIAHAQISSVWGCSVRVPRSASPREGSLSYMYVQSWSGCEYQTAVRRWRLAERISYRRW